MEEVFNGTVGVETRLAHFSYLGSGVERACIFFRLLI